MRTGLFGVRLSEPKYRYLRGYYLLKN